MSVLVKDADAVKLNNQTVDEIKDAQGNTLWNSHILEPTIDNYTIEELAAISDYLESIQDDDYENDPVYKDMKKFMEQGDVWASNSNGEQTGVTCYDAQSFNPAKANSDYLCNFGSSDARNNYVLLHIIGILHDWKSDGTKAGLTLCPVKCIPFTRQYGANGSNWASGTIRGQLQIGAELGGKFPTSITNYIKPVKKFYNGTHSSSTQIGYTIDDMFLLSFSESYAVDFPSSLPAWYKNNGTGFEQTSTEGYVYEFFTKDPYTTSGTNAGQNGIIAAKCYNNSGGGNGSAWSRSINYNAASLGSYWSSSGSLLNNANLSTTYGVLPCFCI